MANIYSPIGRKGYYSFETVEQQGTRYVWNANLDRWDIYGGSDYENKTGNRVPTFVPPTLPPIPGSSPVPTRPLPLPPKPPVVVPTTPTPPKLDPPIKVDPPIPSNVDLDLEKFRFTQYNFVVKGKNDDGKSTRGRLLINGVDKGRVPQALKLSKDDILAGDKTLTATKDGYTCNEEYVISNEVIAGKPGPSGVNRAVVAKKFVNGQLVSSNNQVGSIFTLEFNFKKIVTKVPTPTGPTPTPDPELTLIIGGRGEGVSLLKNNRDEVQISNGVNKITDSKGTKFVFKAKPGYKFVRLKVDGTLLPENTRETPKGLITLDKDVRVIASVVEDRIIDPPPTPTPVPVLVPTPPPPPIIPLPPPTPIEEKRIISKPIVPEGPEPKITLIDKSARTYDIKDKSGLPIAFRKNEEVEAVTVFVGKKHYVFDGLGNKPISGIVIPSSAFEQLGRLEIKIIPYDLDVLDDTVEEITRSAITRTREVVEERIVEVRRPVPTPIEIEERYEEPAAPAIPDPIPYPLPPKPQPKDPIRIVPTRPPKVEQPKPRVVPRPKPRVVPRPQPVRVVPTPPRVVPTPSRGGGRGSGVGSVQPIIDFTTRGGRNTPGSGFDNADGLRTRRIERLL